MILEINSKRVILLQEFLKDYSRVLVNKRNATPKKRYEYEKIIEKEKKVKGLIDSITMHIDNFEWRKKVRAKKRKFNLFKKQVAKESKNYPALVKYKGKFNEKYLLDSFEAGDTVTQCLNSMTEET